MFDSQAPNVQIIADSDDDIHYKAAVNPNREAKTCEHEGDLVDIVSQCAWPAESKRLLKKRAECVNDAESQRECDDVLVRKVQHHKMRGDDLAHAVSVDQADVEDEWDQVVVENVWMKHEIGHDDSPGCEEWEQAKQSHPGLFTSISASLHDVASAGKRCQY